MTEKRRRSSPRRDTRTGATLALLAALAPAFAACAPSRTADESHNQLVTISSGVEASPGERSYREDGTPPEQQLGWFPVLLPENYSRALDLGRYTGYLTLRFQIPPAVVEAALSAEPPRSLALNAGRVSDVSRYALNGRALGGRGAVAPYRSGAMRPFEALIPPEALRPDQANWIYVTLYTRRGSYPLQTMDAFRIGIAEAVLRDYVFQETIAFAFLALYLLAGLYHLFLGLKRRESFQLYFALYAAIVSVYWFVADTATRDLLFGEHVLLNRKTEHVLLFCIVPPFMFFLSRYFKQRHPRLEYGFLAFCLALSIATILGSVHVMRWCATLWHASFLLFVPVFVSAYVWPELRARNRDAYFLAAGLALLLAGAINDVLTSMSWIHTPRVAQYSLAFLVLGLAGLMANRFANASARVEQLLAHTTRLNLELIKKNIHPHFLMNSVNAVLNLIYTEPDRAARTLEALADELRATLQMSDQPLGALSREIDLCRNHLEIMSVRKEKRFRLEVRGDPAGIRIPPLILLTLIENGLTHGYRGRTTGRFELDIEREGGEFVRLRLYNDSPAPRPDQERRSGADRRSAERNNADGSGTGLRYVESRLRETFPEEWRLDYGPVDDGFRVELRFPLL